MEKNVVILDIDYVTYENKPVIRLFSKDKDKETSRMYFEAGQLGWLLHLQKDLI